MVSASSSSARRAFSRVTRGGARPRPARDAARRAGRRRPAVPRSAGGAARAGAPSSVSTVARRSPTSAASWSTAPCLASSSPRRTSASRRGLDRPSRRASTSPRRRRRNWRRSSNPAERTSMSVRSEPDRGGPLLEVGLGGGHGLGPLGGVGLLGLEQREGELELATRACSRASRSPSSSRGPQRLGLGGGIPSVGLDPLESVGGGGEATVVLVELAGERGLGLAGLVEQRPGARAGSTRRGWPRRWRRRPARGPLRGRRPWRRWTRCPPASRRGRSGAAG